MNQPLRSRPRYRTILSAAVIMTTLSTALPVQSQPPAAQRGQWMATMGEAGLRRSYASGADLGELVNRAVSYQMSKRIHDQRITAQPDLDPRSIDSRIESYVTQNDSLLPVDTGLERPLFVRALARVAWRNEEKRVSSRNDRIDVGLLYAPSQYSYIGIGLAGERTTSELRYITGQGDGLAWGPRVDAGVVYNSTWAFSVRYDWLTYRGDSDVSVDTPGGRMDIARDVEYNRQFLDLEAVAHYNASNVGWIPVGTQIDWSSVLQYLDYRYEPQIDSLGRLTQEPFGDHNRLGIVRSTVSVAQRLGENWSLGAELGADYEWENNMDFPIDDPLTGVAGVSITRLFAPGQRLMLEYERYENRRGQRSRDNVSLIATFDF